MLVDAHVHVFPDIRGYGPKGTIKGAGYGRIDQGDGQPIHVLPPTCEVTRHTTEMLLSAMDWAGVDKAVIMQAACYGDFTDYTLETLETYPDKFVAASFFDPWREDAKAYYDRVVSKGPFRFVKFEISEAGGLCGVYPGADLAGEDIAWVWKRLSAEGKHAVFDLGTPGSRSYQTKQIATLAKRYPDILFVVCHMGQPSHKAEADAGLWALWEEQIALGKLPNVLFDISALPYHVQDDEEYPFPSVKRYVDLALETVGAEKLMWGSDVPWMLGTATYNQLAQLGRNLVKNYSKQQQELILAENALRVYFGK